MRAARGGAHRDGAGFWGAAPRGGAVGASAWMRARVRPRGPRRSRHAPSRSHDPQRTLAGEPRESSPPPARVPNWCPSAAPSSSLRSSRRGRLRCAALAAPFQRRWPVRWVAPQRGLGDPLLRRGPRFALAAAPLRRTAQRRASMLGGRPSLRSASRAGWAREATFTPEFLNTRECSSSGRNRIGSRANGGVRETRGEPSLRAPDREQRRALRWAVRRSGGRGGRGRARDEGAGPHRPTGRRLPSGAIHRWNGADPAPEAEAAATRRPTEEALAGSRH